MGNGVEWFGFIQVEKAEHRAGHVKLQLTAKYFVAVAVSALIRRVADLKVSSGALRHAVA
jgi:hypothetical protein